MNIPVALQLYSVRDYAEKDFIGTLEKVAKMGYQGVEFAGFWGLNASELKKELDRLGLKVAGSHTDIKLLQNSLNEVIEYNLEIGNKYIVCPGVVCKSKEEVIKYADILKEVAKECRRNGLAFCYHNHSHEFAVYDGEYGLEILYNRDESKTVQAEIDTYWVKYAGLDPAEYIKKYAGRCPLLHIKDMEKETRDYAEIGNGIIDIKAIASQAERMNVQWLIVEQDFCKRPSIESVEISINNLRKMNLA